MNASPTGAGHRRDDRPLDVSRIADNAPFVLRTFFGLASLVIGANVVGVVVVALTVIATNATATDHQKRAILVAAVIIVVVQVIVGTTSGALVQRRTLRWLLRGDKPSHDDAVRALRMQFDMAVIVIILWFLGDVAIGIVSVAVGQDARAVAAICGGIAIAGLASAGITYLLVGRISDPVTRLALASQPPRSAPVFGLRWRMFMIWVLTSGAPVIGVVLILVAPRDRQNVRAASVFVCVAAVLLGAGATLLTARAIGNPLRDMVRALGEVGEGDLGVELPIVDSGEIGLVQNGFNQMVAGLRERERIQDLFGRHVGPAVAAQAISGGVTLRGESLDVVALFVDITGSTRLTREMVPVEFVEMLNRFFEVVVEEVEDNGGLLNKFEGDAALCVFGAPAEIADPSSAALRTARAIRDRVAALGEHDLGIGVAAGPVIAGQIGTASRLEYTVIGDAVNEAARLTDLAKRAEGRVLASEVVVAAASEEEQRNWVPGRPQRLRGREAATNVFRSPVESGEGGHSLARRLSDVARVVTDFPPTLH